MDFDLIVIGAGPGGYAAAGHAADLGLRTAVVEKDLLGGTCLNRGCMPTKALLHAAGLYAGLQGASRFGVSAEGARVDFSAVHARKNAVVEQLRGGIAQTFRAKKVTLLPGTARIASAHEVRVGDASYSAGNLLIAAGSVPVRPPIPGMELANVVTSDELLSPEGRDFRRLVIIGGGVIGVEIASVYRALGRSVFIVEAAPRILPAMDRELSQSLAALLKKRGIGIAASARVERIEQAEQASEGLSVVYRDKKGDAQRVEADGVLVSVGRRAFMDGLLAEGFTLQAERGALVCDENFETSVKGVFAVGDVVFGNIQLAHAASAQGIAVVDRIAGKAPVTDLRFVPACVYTDPEIASVGMTEEQAKAAGIPILVGKAPVSANGKSLLEQAERGFIKLIFRAEGEVLLGAQMMCPRATDLVASLVLAAANGLTRAQMQRAVLPHPTFSESIGHALESVRCR